MATTSASTRAAWSSGTSWELWAAMTSRRSNVAIAARMFVTEKAVSDHSYSIFTKLGLQQSDKDNRRVLAVLAYLQP